MYIYIYTWKDLSKKAYHFNTVYLYSKFREGNCLRDSVFSRKSLAGFRQSIMGAHPLLYDRLQRIFHNRSEFQRL